VRRRRIYVETSVWNHALADDPSDKKAAAETLIKRAGFRLYVGPAVYEEILRCPGETGVNLLKFIREAGPEVLIDTTEVESLGAFYIARGIIPERYRNDAVHIASATVHEMDFLASYNFKHIVRVKTRAEVAAANVIRGYRPVELVTPEELIEYEK
jgi:predicted nucleic acid-binding protein